MQIEQCKWHRQFVTGSLNARLEMVRKEVEKNGGRFSVFCEDIFTVRGQCFALRYSCKRIVCSVRYVGSLFYLTNTVCHLTSIHLSR